MHSSIDKALTVYKKEFREFTEWLKPIVDDLKKSDPKVAFNPMAQLGSTNWSKYSILTARLDAMETVLGLSKKEIKEIQKEIVSPEYGNK